MRILLSLCAMLISLTGMAQTDAAAKADLDKVINTIRAYPAFELEFEYSLNNTAAGVKDKFEGSAIVQGDMYSLEVMGYHQISDGNNLWSVSKEDEEIMLSAADEESGAMSPSTLLEVYETGMNIAYGDKMPVDGKEIQIIVLSPKDGANKPYHRIEMGLDKKANELAFMYEYGKNGTVTGYKIKSLNKLQAKDAKFFSLANYPAYAEYYIEDLR